MTTYVCTEVEQKAVAVFIVAGVLEKMKIMFVLQECPEVKVKPWQVRSKKVQRSLDMNISNRAKTKS